MVKLPILDVGEPYRANARMVKNSHKRMRFSKKKPSYLLLRFYATADIRLGQFFFLLLVV